MGSLTNDNNHRIALFVHRKWTDVFFFFENGKKTNGQRATPYNNMKHTNLNKQQYINNFSIGEKEEKPVVCGNNRTFTTCVVPRNTEKTQFEANIDNLLCVVLFSFFINA